MSSPTLFGMRVPGWQLWRHPGLVLPCNACRNLARCRLGQVLLHQLSARPRHHPLPEPHGWVRVLPVAGWFLQEQVPPLPAVGSAHLQP